MKKIALFIFLLSASCYADVLERLSVNQVTLDESIRESKLTSDLCAHFTGQHNRQVKELTNQETREKYKIKKYNVNKSCNVDYVQSSFDELNKLSRNTIIDKNKMCDVLKSLIKTEIENIIASNFKKQEIQEKFIIDELEVTYYCKEQLRELLK